MVEWNGGFVQWSPLGTYLATVHRDGAAIWEGASTFIHLMRYAHPQVSMIDFSSGEKYLVTYSRHKPRNSINDIVIGMRSELDGDVANLHFELEFGRGSLTVNFDYAGEMHLNSEQVLLCRFQITIFGILMDKNLNNLYCITGFLDELNGNSLLWHGGGRVLTYKNYYEAREIWDDNYGGDGDGCDSVRSSSVRWPAKDWVTMATKNMAKRLKIDGAATCDSFFESDRPCHDTNNGDAKLGEGPAKSFHVKDYNSTSINQAVCQQLFRTYQNNQEGLLSVKKERIVSNAALCRLGCDHKLPGFIRSKPFDPKKRIIPGDFSGTCLLKEELLSDERKIYIRGRRKITNKSIADVVEALIGAFLSSCGEMAAVHFMNWVGIKVDLTYIPYDRNFPVQPEKLINVKDLEELLNYSFRDPSLLLEALTHFSKLLFQKAEAT
ncbi:hypothetical protein M0R45_031275 [Rubus argutus]|uniref:RNase III domain-containing protein n=1 Tax=Rubus argutus TaxID=59490 RepID=A0AAW1WDS3_RUBAR